MGDPVRLPPAFGLDEAELVAIEQIGVWLKARTTLADACLMLGLSATDSWPQLQHMVAAEWLKLQRRST
jgi:hypothetical protein